MENKTLTTHENGNDANRLLAAVSIDEAAQIIQTLMEYGNLKTVQGVIYGGASHSHYLQEASVWLHKYRSARNGS
jgi:hypothetical protein